MNQPIQSDILSQEALAYLNELQQVNANTANTIGRHTAKQELLAWAVAWFTSSQTWRKQSYEDDWLAFQRNADGRYDPRLAAKKKDWQAKLFVDITPSHRENIHAELFRLVAGSRPILDVSPRPGGDTAQAENIRDLELREFEKSKFEVVYNSLVEDKTTYGSSICRAWYETKVEDRVVRVPVAESLDLSSMGSIRRHMSGQPQIVGYQAKTEKRVVYRGIRLQHVSIWDFFPDPKALTIKGHTCLFRSWLGLQDIMDQVRAGNFYPESASIMSQMASLETQPADKSMLNMERGIADQAPRREGNQKTWEAYEMFGRLPQKWVYPLLKEPMEVTDADALVPARVIFNKQTVFCVELNDDYEGEPPFLKDDYFPVSNRFYGRGICEMLMNSQKVINEVVNQRLDEGNIALQSGYAVIEKALVNPEDLIAGGPGLVVRMKANQLGPNGDVSNAIFPLPKSDVHVQAGFTEVHEWERMAMERTSANRVSLGSAGLLHDSNRTMGGMQILKQTAGEKFAFIAMLSEFAFLNDLFRTYWKLIYKNLTPQDVKDALGEERAAKFQMMSPEEVDTSYRYEPKGIFEREAKATLQARLKDLYAQFQGAPWISQLAFFDAEAKSFGIDPERLKIPESEAMEIMGKAQQMAQPMAKQMLTDIVMQTAVRDVERNMAEKMAEQVAPKPVDAPAARPEAAK